MENEKVSLEEFKEMEKEIDEGLNQLEAMPEVNEKNSIDYVELLKESMTVESENEAA